jgi:hypothetical protein
MDEVAKRGQHGMDMISCVCPASAQVIGEAFSLETALLGELIRRGSAVGEFQAPNPDGDANVVLRVAEIYAPGGARVCEADERRTAFALLLRGIRSS